MVNSVPGPFPLSSYYRPFFSLGDRNRNCGRVNAHVPIEQHPSLVRIVSLSDRYFPQSTAGGGAAYGGQSSAGRGTAESKRTHSEAQQYETKQ